jgi:hypothetical protein
VHRAEALLGAELNMSMTKVKDGPYRSYNEILCFSSIVPVALGLATAHVIVIGNPYLALLILLLAQTKCIYQQMASFGLQDVLLAFICNLHTSIHSSISIVTKFYQPFT